jgi:hypothetical protein
MYEKTPFVKWWMIFISSILGFYFAYVGGLINTLWEIDSFKISFIIIAIYMLNSLKCGMLTWRHRDLYDMDRVTSSGWFWAENCFTLGLIGTVVGFIQMFDGGSSAEALIESIKAGAGTALYTTLFGAVCGILLKLQWFNLEQTWNDE